MFVLLLLSCFGTLSTERERGGGGGEGGRQIDNERKDIKSDDASKEIKVRINTSITRKERWTHNN